MPGVPSLHDRRFGNRLVRTDACFLKDFQTWLNGPLPTGTNFTTQLKTFRDTANVGGRHKK